MALSFSINILTGYIFISRPNKILGFLTGNENLLFAQASFYLQGIFCNLNERETSSLDCKHKHMLQKTLHIEFHGFNSRIDVSGLSYFGFSYELENHCSLLFSIYLRFLNIFENICLKLMGNTDDDSLIIHRQMATLF